jgi:hypothetical protein
MIKTICKRAMISALIIYVVLLGLMFAFQRKLQYHPSGKIFKISEYSLSGFKEKFLVTEDHKKILAWYKPSKAGHKLIVYFHGNAGNLGERAHKFDDFAKDGFGVLAISYRGYAGSEGKPTEKGLIKDGEAALKFLFESNYNLQDLIFFGESLGSGVAVQLAARFNPYALILESPFSSAASVGQKTYWFAPVGLLMKDKFKSIKFAPKVFSPVLIFHGTADKVVPYSEGQKLFAAFNSQKKFVSVDNAGHLDFSDDFLTDEMGKFLGDLM